MRGCKTDHMNLGPEGSAGIMKLYRHKYPRSVTESRSASWSHNQVRAEAAKGATQGGNGPQLNPVENLSSREQGRKARDRESQRGLRKGQVCVQVFRLPITLSLFLTLSLSLSLSHTHKILDLLRIKKDIYYYEEKFHASSLCCSKTQICIAVGAYLANCLTNAYCTVLFDCVPTYSNTFAENRIFHLNEKKIKH